jgi:hypothetical protein
MKATLSASAPLCVPAALLSRIAPQLRCRGGCTPSCAVPPYKCAAACTPGCHCTHQHKKLSTAHTPVRAIQALSRARSTKCLPHDLV